MHFTNQRVGMHWTSYISTIKSRKAVVGGAGRGWGGRRGFRQALHLS